MQQILNLTEQRWILFLDSQWIFPSFLLEDKHSENLFKRQHKTCENDFFVLLSTRSVCCEQIHIRLISNLFAVPEPDLPLCWKMTHAAINTECLKQYLTTLSQRLGSPGLSYYSKAQNMYPGPEVEHRQQTAAPSTSWKLSSWLSLIWSWCLQWKQNRRPNHIRRITSFFRRASFCPQEIESFLPHNKELYWYLVCAHSTQRDMGGVCSVSESDWKRNYIIGSMHFTLSGFVSRGEVELH